MNKKLLLSIFLGLFLINFMSALDCNYTEPKTIQELKLGIYNADGTFFGDPLILKDFVGTYCGFDCGGTPSFTIANQYSLEMHINLSALLFKPGLQAYPEAKSTIIREITLAPYGEYKFEGSNIGIGSNYFPNDSITYTFLNSTLSLKTDYRDVQITICEICEGGKLCLEDGMSCTWDSDCGSDICSGMSICVKTESERNDCGSLLSFCDKNKKCVQRQSKSFGDLANCEFECKSGFIENGKCKTCNNAECLNEGISCSEDYQCGSGNCNNNRVCGPDAPCRANTTFCNATGLCLESSTKNVGQAYSCIFECKSGVGKDGVCKHTFETWMKANLWWLTLVIILGLILIIGYNKNLWKKLREIKIKGAEEKGKEIITEAEKKARIIVESAEKRLVDISNDLENKKKEKKELERNLASLTGENNEVHKIKDSLKKVNDEIKELTIQQEEEYKKNWATIKPFPDAQASNRLVIINPHLGGYKCFYEKGKSLENYPYSSLIHRWVWKEHHQGRWPKKGYHIHHINGDKYNNNITNLEEVEGEEHYERHRTF